MRRGLAAVLVALLMGTWGAPLTCAGWESSAADRMACCRHAHPSTAGDQTAADACCARHEQARQPASHVAAQLLQHLPSLVPIGFPSAGSAFPLDLSRPVYAAAAVMHHGALDLFSPPLRV